MAKLDISVFKSKIIKIEVGPSCMVAYLHSGLLKFAEFPEANNQNADDVDTDSPEKLIWINKPVEDIFAYVFEYLCTGDYSIPLPRDVAPACFNEKWPRTESDFTGNLNGNMFESLQSIQEVSDYIVRGIYPQPALPSNGGKHQYSHG
ncbi:hypothetical protein EYZ11_005512 [Aspergillus tanneri]|uniref:Uncharacterized protein n=1 Tax=Aspergillus tanneri TaxID=1220188 RepID=A0A4S3JIB1_9EURO|nr:uncharacterized protein ATNIH1004_007550 [Aspergillus tanneri]KAA8646124.1 hypothetical protein ATNIH1004_007550 [Aspergillus tanneri]THC95000.1 hypothetical protein EYZ11_005512 [Aspergillus tanneri]